MKSQPQREAEARRIVAAIDAGELHPDDSGDIQCLSDFPEGLQAIETIINFHLRGQVFATLLQHYPFEVRWMDDIDVLLRALGDRYSRVMLQEELDAEILRDRAGQTGDGRRASTQLTYYRTPHGTCSRIEWNRFYPYCATEVRNRLRRSIQREDSSCILDLRGNPGGYTDEAVKIIGAFTSNHAITRVEQNSKYCERGKGEVIVNGMPSAVLVDSDSASASSVVASVLQFRGLASIIGEQTKPKCISQQTIPIREPEGFGLKLTTSRWTLPDGSSIADTNGVVPDIHYTDLDKPQPSLHPSLLHTCRKLYGVEVPV